MNESEMETMAKLLMLTLVGIVAATVTVLAIYLW